MVYVCVVWDNASKGIGFHFFFLNKSAYVACNGYLFVPVPAITHKSRIITEMCCFYREELLLS